MSSEEENENMEANMSGNDEKEASPKERGSNKKVFIVAAAALVVGLAVGGVFFNFAPDVTGLAENGEEEAAVVNGGEEEGINGFEEAKPQLEEQLAQQKEQELMIEHLEELKAESEIEKSLEVIGEGNEDAAVATVNGQEIKKSELKEMEEEQLAQMEAQGMDPDSEEMSAMLEQQRDEIMDNLITEVVLEQRVEEEGITVSDATIAEEYQQIAQQFGGEEQLEQQLEAEGLTREELEDQIAEQLPLQEYLQSYVDDNLDPADLEFSEEELREMYEMQQQQQQQMQMQIE